MGTILQGLLIPKHLDYLLVNPELQILEWSFTFCQTFCDSAAVRVGEDIREIFPELFGVEEILELILRHQQESFELKAITRSIDSEKNYYLDLYCNGYQWQSEQYLVFFLEDVTDRMCLEQALVQSTNETHFYIRALKESEERYRDLFENASDLIQSVDLEGKFLYVNKAWRNTFGYSEAEVANIQLSDVIHPHHISQCLEFFKQVIQGHQLGQVKLEFMTKNGRKIILEGNINCRFIDEKPVATRAIFRDITQRLQMEQELHLQRQQTERLLLNILPLRIAERLKRHNTTIAESFTNVSVLFADIVGFTEFSTQVSAKDLVGILNVIFSAFDEIAEWRGLEKIKTIGDAYMVVGGLPEPCQNHAENIALMALDMQTALTEFNTQTGQAFSLRMGINSGAAIAGVIGKRKFTYDIWGDTVNVASRMESHGVPGKIQVSEATYVLLQDQFLFEQRGKIIVKGRGEMNTYFLLGQKPN